MRTLLVFLFFCSSASQSAVPPSERSVRKALTLPLSQRRTVLAKLGPQGVQRLRAMIFDGKEHYKVRWAALMTFARLGGASSIPELERALQSQDWFLRDGGLQALSRISKGKSLKWARRLLSDPALVVRTTAVSVLRKWKDRESAPRLWKELNSKQNFRGKHSLWIRHHIVQALAELDMVGQEARFFEVLNDKDERLHAPAIRGLERLTGNSFAEKHKAISEQRKAWLTWYSAQR